LTIKEFSDILGGVVSNISSQRSNGINKPTPHASCLF